MAQCSRSMLVVVAVLSAAAWARGGGGQSANDQRSNSLNPNNSAYQAGLDNRANQLNPEHPAYRSSRGSDGDDWLQTSSPVQIAPVAEEGVSPPTETPGAGPSLFAARESRRTAPSATGWVAKTITALAAGALGLYLAMVAFVRSRRRF